MTSFAVFSEMKRVEEQKLSFFITDVETKYVPHSQGNVQFAH